MMKLKVPSKKQFRDYLKGLTERNVTKFCKSGNCPIAQYIVDNSGLSKGWTVLVGTEHITATPPDDEPEISVVAPAWFEHFIHNVDVLNDLKNKGARFWEGTTPLEALFALDFPARIPVE